MVSHAKDCALSMPARPLLLPQPTGVPGVGRAAWPVQKGRLMAKAPLQIPLKPSIPRGPAQRRRRRALSFRPAAATIRRMLGQRSDVLSAACDRWQIAPGSTTEVRRSRCLPGQFERIEGAEFGTVEAVVSTLEGGFGAAQSATMAYRLRDVLLYDGVLYAGEATRHLRGRSRHLPAAFSVNEYAGAALYESWLGNRWFGNWLSDDCLTYRLAEEIGRPFTTGQPTGHKQAYETRLAMQPHRGASAWFDDLVLFDDLAQNDCKRARANDMRHRLLGGAVGRHAGVYLLRGQSGDRRVLLNERAIAEHLAVRRGFQVLDPSTTSIEDIARACGGAQVVAGVEGSHLVHGLMMMPPGACAFVIQPPRRAVCALKLLTDAHEQDFAFVVGKGKNDGFIADADEIERTLDLV